MPVNGFQHHDGVVHHDADDQHQREHGEDVHRISHDVEHRKGTNDRHRDGHNRDERCPQIAEKNEDDEHYQTEGDGQRVPHLANGFFYVNARVITHRHLYPVRQGGLDCLHFRADGLSHIHRVGLGLLDDAQENAGFAGGAGDGAVIRNAVFSPTHILEPNQVGSFGPQHEVVELIDRLHLAAGLNGHFPVQVLHAPAGQFDALLPERLLNIEDRNAPSSHPRRIKPQAHRIAFLATDGNGGHAADPLEAGLDLLFRERGHL